MTRSSGHLAGDPPRPRRVALFDVLTGDQGEQSDELLLVVVERHAVERVEDRSGVVDQTGDQLVAGGGVIPGACRFARLVVVMSDNRDRGGCRDRPANPADHRHQLRHGVLGGHRIIEQRRVQRPAGPAGEHPGLGDDVTDGVEDPLRTITHAQLVAPQRQHRWMKPLIIEGETSRDLPAQIGAQRLRRLAVREPFQRLQHHHRGDHISGHRRTTPTRREQVGEQLVREQPAAMLREERVDGAGRHQMADQRRSVQQLPVRIRRALHAHHSFRSATENASTLNPDCSARS